MQDRSSNEKTPDLPQDNRNRKRGQGPRDANQIAVDVVRQAIGEAPQLEPSQKNPPAVTLGRLGGLLGGKAKRLVVVR
jgi:hypothetical protein